jgi:uncharacterized coiled-coil DUF342 family protein
LVYEGKSKMSDTPTPETERIKGALHTNWNDLMNHARKLESERDEARKELDQTKDALGDALVALAFKNLQADQVKGERDEAREEVKELIYIAERGIALAEIDFENDKFRVVSELRDALERIKEGAK